MAGATGLLLVRVNSIKHAPAGGSYLLAFDSLSVRLGAVARAPRMATIRKDRYCGQVPVVSDTLLWPVREDGSVNRPLPCPCLLRVVDGYVPSLAVHLGNLRRRLGIAGGRTIVLSAGSIE